MPGHIMKRFYNLQPVDFNKRPQYTRAKLSRCTRANHFESRSQTEKTTFPGLQTCNQFSILNLCRKLVVRFVDMNGEVVFSVGTWLKVAFSGAACQFCKCSVAFIKIYLHVAELWHVFSRLQTNSYLNSYMGKTQSFLISQSANRKWHCWRLIA